MTSLTLSFLILIQWAVSLYVFFFLASFFLGFSFGTAITTESLFDSLAVSENIVTLTPVTKGWEVASDCGKSISFSLRFVFDSC